MKTAILLLALLLAAPSGEVVVSEAEPLASVARRTLGDARAASELKALNGLSSDIVPAGTTLKLPGPDREHARLTLASARTAVKQAVDRKAERREEAASMLKEAEAHFQAARYADAALMADTAARHLVSASPSQPQAFTVAVSDGGTTVKVKSGKPVRVDAEGVSRQVRQGESVHVSKGQPPPPPPPPLAAPRLTAPSDGRKFTFLPVKGGLGPVTLAWSAVAGAQAYEVEVVPAKGKPMLLNVQSAQARLQALPAGRYHWTVRAVGQAAKSEASAVRRFELVDESLKLEVKGSKWK